MLVAGFPAGSFAANCYVVAAEPGAECVIIDPGESAEPGVAELVREHRLTPAAVLLTHGHLDHMFAVASVCATYDVPCYVHPADRHLLSDPLAGLPAAWADALPVPTDAFREPSDVREVTDTARLVLAGVEFVVDHVPGHTGGSVAYRISGDSPSGHGAKSGAEKGAEKGAGQPELMFSGDLLFAGSIGRTDLPGGDHATILRSLADKVLPRPDDTVVLPGHGDRTTIGRERATNPFLTELSGAPSGPTRGQ